MRFTESFNDTVWLSYPRPLRSFREMKDLNDRIAYAVALRAMGFNVDEAIHVYRMNPQDAMEARIASGVSQPGIIPSLNVSDYPRAADLIVALQPFDYSNRQGDTTGKVRNAVGTTWRPLLSDRSDIGALYSAQPPQGTADLRPPPPVVYEKLLVPAEGGLDPEFTSDWSEDGDFVTTWARIA